MHALAILRDEHRTLAALLHGMLYLVRDIRAGRAVPDFKVLGAMVYYIDTFPERFHHPKEDRYLFRLLRLRCQAARPLLDDLQAQHRAGQRKLAMLSQALTRYQQGGCDEFHAFAASAESYAAFEFAHMRTEETELMPLAAKYLSSTDWEEIDQVFLDHDDPLFGVAAGENYRELFRRIVHIAPPPIGVGPAGVLPKTQEVK
jgi:hemerythrin-like domain-containing protein